MLSLACVMIGQYIAFRFSTRVRLLEKLLLMLDSIENEISYLSRPTTELLEVLSKNSEFGELDFLKKCISLVKSGYSIDSAWSCAVSESRVLAAEDITVLLSFAEFLGKSDIDGQISNCHYHSELIREKLCRAREKRDRCSTVSRGLGLLTGIGVFIILF